jgi:hypothetical protein
MTSLEFRPKAWQRGMSCPPHPDGETSSVPPGRQNRKVLPLAPQANQKSLAFRAATLLTVMSLLGSKRMMLSPLTVSMVRSEKP